VITDQLPPQMPQPETTGAGVSSMRSARPRWLLAAIVAVVILAALIGVVAGLTINERHSGGSASAAADYVPADATVYYEVRLDLPGDQRANFETLLGHFPAEAKTMLLEGGLETLLDSGSAAEPSGMSYTTDVKPWFDGSLAMAMVGYPQLSPTAGMTSVVPDVLAFAGVKDADAARAAIDRLRSQPGMSGATSTTHDGFTIWSLSPSQADAAGIGFAWTVTADEVVMGTSSDLVARALDVHAGSRPALANRTEFRDGLARLPADRVATFSVDPSAILAAVRSEMASAAPSAAPLFDAMTANAATFTVGSARFEGDRLVMDESAALPSGSTAANHDTKLAESVPGDAFLYASASDVGTRLAAAIGSMMDVLGTSASADQMQQMQSILGGDLPSLVSWIGDAAVVAGEDGDQPYAGLVITPTDAHEASVRLLQLQGLIQLGGTNGGPKVTVTDADHNGTRITTIAFAGVPADAAWAGSIQYAVTDTRVVIGTGTSFVARVLDMTKADSLAGQSRFASAVDAVGGPDNLGVTWLDLAGIRTVAERAAGSSLPAEVEPWLMPFDYLAAASRVDSGRQEAHAVLVVK
jgi:Protein of unknown function (DUF3352)